MRLPLLVAVLADASAESAESAEPAASEVLELADLCRSSNVAAAADGRYVWGDWATLQAYAAASQPELLASVSWVLTGSEAGFDHDLAVVEAADWLESLKQLYIEYPVEQLPNRRLGFPAAVDLRRVAGSGSGPASSGSAASSGSPAASAHRSLPEQVAAVVWALWHGAELLTLNATAADLTAAQQARQVCCAGMAA